MQHASGDHQLLSGVGVDAVASGAGAAAGTVKERVASPGSFFAPGLRNVHCARVTFSAKGSVKETQGQSGLSQEMLDALCVEQDDNDVAGEDENTFEEELLRCRRMRTFLGQEKAAAYAAQIMESLPPWGEDAGKNPAQAAPTGFTLSTSRGVQQSELDELCVMQKDASEASAVVAGHEAFTSPPVSPCKMEDFADSTAPMELKAVNSPPVSPRKMRSQRRKNTASPQRGGA